MNTRKIKADLKKLGFTIVNYKDQDPMQRIVRRNMHRYIAGRYLIDTNKIIQAGVNEEKALPIRVSEWDQWPKWIKTKMDIFKAETDKAMPFMVIGPDNKFIAYSEVN